MCGFSWNTGNLEVQQPYGPLHASNELALFYTALCILLEAYKYLVPNF